MGRSVCPYCSTSFRERVALRLHVMTNSCGQVPDDAVLQATEGEKAATEAQFQRAVMSMATETGWRICHVRKGRGRDGAWLTNTSAAGFPDLVLLRPPRLVFLELKRDRGSTTSDEQVEWIADLQGVEGAVEAFFVKPRNWPDIEALLRPTEVPEDAVASPT